MSWVERFARLTRAVQPSSLRRSVLPLLTAALLSIPGTGPRAGEEARNQAGPSRGEEIRQPSENAKAVQGQRGAENAETTGRRPAVPSPLQPPTNGTRVADATPIEEAGPPPAPYSGVLGYLRDRALDLGDLFRFRFHAPRGCRSIGVKARGTCLAQVGAIYFDGRSAGIDRRAVGVWHERRLEGGVGPIYFSSVRDEMAWGNRYTDVKYAWSRLHRRGIVRDGVYWDDGRLHPLSCGAEVQLVFFGVEAETYPLQWIDAALGWFGFDPPSDDESRILRRWQARQSIPELYVRDEWEEPAAPTPEKPAPVEQPISPPQGAKIVPPGETEAPPPELKAIPSDREAENK